jgi:hypothetical protein
MLAHLMGELKQILPAYEVDWIGYTYLLRTEVLDCKEQNNMMVGISEEGVFIYGYKTGGYATMSDFNNHDHTAQEFDELIEPIYLIDNEGNYDLDFLIGTDYVHADTFDTLLGDYNTLVKWLREDV